MIISQYIQIRNHYAVHINYTLILLKDSKFIFHDFCESGFLYWAPWKCQLRMPGASVVQTEGGSAARGWNDGASLSRAPSGTLAAMCALRMLRLPHSLLAGFQIKRPRTTRWTMCHFEQSRLRILTAPLLHNHKPLILQEEQATAALRSAITPKRQWILWPQLIVKDSFQRG